MERDKEIKVADFDFYIGALEEANFARIPTKQLLGKEGYYEVVNSEDKIVYSSNGSEDNNLTLKEMGLLMNYYEGVAITEVYSKKYKKDVKLIEWGPHFSNEEQPGKGDILIIDKDRNILFTSGRIGGKRITQRQLDIMTGSEEDGYVLRKCEFNRNGEDYTAVMYVAKTKITRLSKFITPFSAGITLFAVMYVVLLFIFARWINKKVTSPITLLNKAILDFRDKKTVKHINYKGLSELENICRSFDELAETLVNTERKQKDLEDAKKKLIADISHDLKTPITVIQGYSEAINMGILTKEQEKEYTQIIHSKAKRLTELIDTLFEYSSFEHNDYKMELKPADICEVTRKYLADKYDEIKLNGYELEIEVPEEEIIVNINEVQMTRVFENIISNSIKYAQKGDKIFFEIEKIDGKVNIVIGDNGLGIPEEFEKSIFLPFYQANNARGNGSGLGLAVCKRIVELHKGTISVDGKKTEKHSILFKIVLDIEENE
ncbi:MAG: HAMP domain-containing sensor histidine kinase [Anaerovoracaceae bacterium]